MVLKSFLIASLVVAGGLFEAEFEKLSLESKKSKPICEAFEKTAEKLVGSSPGIEHFKTHVLAEAAMSQLKSYPGTPKATQKATRLALDQAGSIAHHERFVNAFASLQYCKLSDYNTLWQKLLTSASHFNFRPEKRAEIRKSLLKQLERDTSAPSFLVFVVIPAQLLNQLGNDGFLEADFAAKAASFAKKAEQAVTEHRKKQNPEKARSKVLKPEEYKQTTAVIIDELRRTETLRLEFRQLLEPILKAHL